MCVLIDTTQRLSLPASAAVRYIILLGRRTDRGISAWDRLFRPYPPQTSPPLPSIHLWEGELNRGRWEWRGQGYDEVTAARQDERRGGKFGISDRSLLPSSSILRRECTVVLCSRTFPNINLVPSPTTAAAIHSSRAELLRNVVRALPVPPSLRFALLLSSAISVFLFLSPLFLPGSTERERKRDKVFSFLLPLPSAVCGRNFVLKSLSGGGGERSLCPLKGKGGREKALAAIPTTAADPKDRLPRGRRKTGNDGGGQREKSFSENACTNIG